MEPVIVWYLRMSVFYFIAGTLIGFYMILRPGEAVYYITAHVHLNLLGFMSMMIYGVGYHILPKFSGRLIYSTLMVNAQFWLANAGLFGMGISWPLFERTGSSLTQNVLQVSSFLTLAAVVLFAINILKTVRPVKMN